MRWKRRVNKTWRLFHVDLFGKNTIEEGIMNIKLMNLPISRNRNRENQSDSGLLNNWTEGFRIINTFLLGKTSSNKPRFIALNTTINMTFDPIYRQQRSSKDEMEPKTKCNLSAKRRSHHT
jgi:hypothetical protein